MKNKLKEILKPTPRKNKFVITVGLVGLFFHYSIMFWSLYKIQSPIVIELRSPVVSRYVNVVPKDDSDVRLPEKGNEGVKVVTPTPSATPTPQMSQKSLKIDLVSNVEASEIHMPYENQIVYMDEQQKAVMRKVEDTLGKQYAELIFRESGFHNESVNSIGACGLPQALPCEKMACELSDVDCQLNWIKQYVERRYGTPEKALDFHRANGYY